MDSKTGLKINVKQAEQNEVDLKHVPVIYPSKSANNQFTRSAVLEQTRKCHTPTLMPVESRPKTSAGGHDFLPEYRVF